MKIGMVAKRSGLSVDTLRYYEKIGLLPNPARDRGGRRDYEPSILIWLEFLGRLKSTGMPLKSCIAYATLREQGDETRAQRRAILEEHFTNVLAQRAALSETLDILAGKIASYRSFESQTELDYEPSKYDPKATL